MLSTELNVSDIDQGRKLKFSDYVYMPAINKYLKIKLLE